MPILKKDKTLYLIALFLFILSAIYGLIIRWNFVFPIPDFNYRNFLQSHSHVAFLGWGYVATIGAILTLFIPKEKQGHLSYKISLLVIIVTVALMLISFPLLGYKLFSIVLLCVFGVTSYVLSFRLLKDISGRTIPEKLIKSGIYYYLVSSLATWFLAYVLVSQGKTILYYNTVYFYLHFLYNGFFVFVLFGLLFKLFEFQEIKVSEKFQKNFYIFLNIACIPTYVLSILWSGVSPVYNIIGFIASIFQLIALFFLLKIVKQVTVQLKWRYISKLLLIFGVTAFSLKIGMQVLSSFKYFVDKSLALKPFFIIGYLHLFTLAFMSVFIFLMLFQLKKLSISSVFSKVGVSLFLIGVLLTELFIFSQGFLILLGLESISNYNSLLLFVSVLIVIGLLFIFTSQFRKTKLEVD